MRGRHGCIPPVDYPFRSVLATGIAGAGAVSDRVAAHTAISNHGNRGERRSWIDQRNIHAADPALARTTRDLNQGCEFSLR